MNIRNNEFKTEKLIDGMVVAGQPHTRDIKNLSSAANGPITSSYYFLCKYFDVFIDGELVLSELAKLQDVDKNSKTYGCCRWYREEPCIRDTNGAFFVLSPIVESMLFCREKISGKEQEIIKSLLEHSANWFAEECKKHGYYYPNKIMSDGALYLAIAKLTMNKNMEKDAYGFWYRWIEYTDNYGWGWGENTSALYTTIMVAALNIALSCLDKEEELFKKLFEYKKTLCNYFAYHGEKYSMVPSIRIYNFNGLAEAPNHFNSHLFSSEYYRLANKLLGELSPQYVPNYDSAVFHKEHIFGDSNAFIYKGENIRLGTINKFPVMPGIYQNKGWGLGWQSMPVSVLALKHEMSFLRFASITQGKLRAHPAIDKHSAFLDNALFGDENIPDVCTVSNQKNNTAVIIRTVDHLANLASYFADEWYFQHFDGELCEYNGWYVFDYGDCVLAIQPINCCAEVIRTGENIRLVQKYYEGEEKILVKRQWITTWATVVFDDNDSWKEKLDKIPVSYEEKIDLRYPRENKPFKIVCGEAFYEFDPYKNDLI